ncbi:protein trichome birefringence-like 34 [Musa acuminata AAA Group]|uniref:protein trichome birefringence-like 34 n=1 Tax=Musa acuminata AAA Group TaxID=214697 RepID=UPI0031CDE419
MAKKSNLVLQESWWMRTPLPSVFFIIILVFVVVVLFISLSYDKVEYLSPKIFDRQQVNLMSVSADETRKQKCDLFSGRWVYDYSTQPLYSGVGCSYMNDEVACEKFGRKDLEHQRWRWQPHGCRVPRFDPEKLLNRLTGKRMVFVGDSLNRNQWVSMVCMLESAMSSDGHSMSQNGSLRSFKAKDFNASIDFYWSPLLVESNCDDPVHHRLSDRMMRANSIDAHAQRWADADILVFNSYLWWKKPGMKMKVIYDGSFEDEDNNMEEMEMIDGFGLALKAWSDWLESHRNRSTQLFFVSLSPTHSWGYEWGAEGNQNCYNQTQPIEEEGYTGKGSDYKMMRMVEETVERLSNKGVDVQLLNITQLSEYRKDGHPSIYRKFWDDLGKERVANPSGYSDCTHWCLPGVPDVWNELLYAFIVSQEQV